MPDFSFCHESGKTVPVEIVGYWTPEYLAAKRKTLRVFGDRNIFFAAAESVRPATVVSDPNVTYFRKSLPVRSVQRTGPAKCVEVSYESDMEPGRAQAMYDLLQMIVVRRMSLFCADKRMEDGCDLPNSMGSSEVSHGIMQQPIEVATVLRGFA